MENTLSGTIIDKPKIRVIKKVIRKRPPTTPITDVEAARLSEQLLNLNLDGKATTTTSTTTTTTTDTKVLQKKSDILKKTIKEKIHHDKLAYEAQMTLIEEDVTESQLKTHFYNLLQPEHYKDIITERSYAGKCGYPGCNKLISSKKLNQKYLISIKDQKVYNVEELSKFCSADCLIKSKLYHSSLDATAVYLRGVESKKLSPTQETTEDTDVEMTPLTSQPSSTTTSSSTTTTTATKPKPQPMEILNKFEKSLEITENENASLQPPNMEFGATDHEKPIKKPTLKKQQQVKKNNDNDDYLDEIETEESSDDNYDDEEDDESINDIGEDYEGPMVLKEDEDEEEYDDQEIDKDLDDKSDKSDKSDDEFSLFRPVVISNKKINQLYKPSNYHLVYSALSQFTSKHTNQYLQGKNNDQEEETTPATNNITTKQNQQIKSNFLHSLSLVFPSISEELCFKNTSGKEIILLLVDTFKFDKPVPSLRRNHWKMLVLVFLKSLSTIHEVLSIEMNIHSSKFENLVSSCDFDMETLKVFQNLLTFGYD